MAKGDVISGFAASGDPVRPPAGQEWFITLVANAHANDTASLTDGTNTRVVATLDSAGVLSNARLALTHAVYLVLTTASLTAYVGIQTK
jgi:hypothetical protein